MEPSQDQTADPEALKSWGEGSEIIASLATAAKTYLPQLAPELAEDIEGAGTLVGGLADSVVGACGIGEAVSGFRRDGVSSDEGWSGVGNAINGLGSAGLTTAAVLTDGAAVAGIETGPLDLLAAVPAAGLTATAEAVDGALAATTGAGLAAGLIGGEDAEFGPGDITGGLLRETIGDKSIGASAASAAYDSVGGGVAGDLAGTGAFLAGNALGLPLNVADAVIGGVVNETSAIFDGDEEKSDTWGDFKSSVASAL